MFKRYPVVGFVALAYLFTWPFQILGFLLAGNAGTAISNEDNFHHFSNILTLNIPGDRLLAYLVYNLGQFGPLLAAFLVTAAIYGRAGVRDLLARTLKWRVAPRWYLTVLAIPLILVGISLAAALLVDGFNLGPFAPKVSWVLFVPFLLYMIVFTGLAEEPGWRGFALPHLQANYSAARSSWILGLIWGVWHFPMSLYMFLEQPLMLIPNLIMLTLAIVGWTIVNTWVYNNTRSVFLIILLHGWFNTLQSYMILSQPNFLAWTLYTLIPWAMAIILAKRYGDENLGDAPRPKWWPGRYPTEQRGEAEPVALPRQERQERQEAPAT